MIIEGYFFLFHFKTICCDPSSEPSCQGGSDEGSQHMFLCRINKTHPVVALWSKSMRPRGH